MGPACSALKMAASGVEVIPHTDVAALLGMSDTSARFWCLEMGGHSRQVSIAVLLSYVLWVPLMDAVDAVPKRLQRTIRPLRRVIKKREYISYPALIRRLRKLGEDIRCLRVL